MINFYEPINCKYCNKLIHYEPDIRKWNGELDPLNDDDNTIHNCFGNKQKIKFSDFE